MVVGLISLMSLAHGFDIDDISGIMYDREAMKLWSREYEPGWKPTI
jgi:hypothetical protein